MGVFSRSLDVFKIVFSVMKKDKELLLFPLFSGIFSSLFILAILVPTIITTFIKTNSFSGIIDFIIIFLVYLGLAFIATFFNTCVVYTTKKRFANENASFFDSVKFSFSKIGLIFSWSIFSASVGLILRVIERLSERLGFAGQLVIRIMTAIMGAVWSIISIFVVPSMVYKNLGPIKAVKDSIKTLKKTWGESLIRYYGLGLIQFLAIFLGLIIFGVLIFFSISVNLYLVIGLFILLIIYVLFLAAVFSVANTIFNTALYSYSISGVLPAGFDEKILSLAFKSSKKKVFK